MRYPPSAILSRKGIARYVRSGKSQNESFPNFSTFRPEFCSEFCSEFFPNFSRTSRASFRGRRRPEKIHQKSPPFFNAKFPGKHEKIIHKILLESRQSNDMGGISHWAAKPYQKSTWIGVLWAGLRVAMWITHVAGKFRHGLLETSLIPLTCILDESTV